MTVLLAVGMSVRCSGILATASLSISRLLNFCLSLLLLAFHFGRVFVKLGKNLYSTQPHQPYQLIDGQKRRNDGCKEQSGRRE